MHGSVSRLDLSAAERPLFADIVEKVGQSSVAGGVGLVSVAKVL
jgi:hypothetical protein